MYVSGLALDMNFCTIFKDSYDFPHSLLLPKNECTVLFLCHFRDSYDFPRSWLLPVLRVSVQQTELAYFTSYFLPLAAKLRLKCKQFVCASLKPVKNQTLNKLFF